MGLFLKLKFQVIARVFQHHWFFLCTCFVDFCTKFYVETGSLFFQVIIRIIFCDNFVIFLMIV